MGATIDKLKNIKFGVVTIILALYLLVNTNLFFGNEAQDWNRIILVYIVMTAYLFATPDLRSKLFEINFWQNFPRFIISALIGFTTITALGIIFLGNTINQYLTSLSFGIILTQAFIIAVCEESMFREYLEIQIGRYPSNFVFAIFHYSVYQGNMIKTLLAFGMGLIMSYTKQKIGQQKGLVSIIGAHAGLNIAQYV